MGRGSSKAGGGGGNGTTAKGAANNAFDQALTAQVNTIVQGLKPNIYGRVLAPEINKAGKQINKMLEVGDQVVVQRTQGNETAYTKYSDGWFTGPNGWVGDMSDVARNLSTANQLGGASFGVRKK